AVVSLQNADATCNGRIEAMPEGGTPPYSISWSNGATGDLIDNLCPGVYTLFLSDGKNCQMVQNYVVELIMSDGEPPAAAPTFRLWPQPAHAELWIRSDTEMSPLRWEATDAVGRAMPTRIQRATAGIWRLDLSGYAPGVYVLRVWSADGKRGAWDFVVY
ncbi:MAG: hypothetical protein ACK4NS_06175, partial [Saprospiraceae bacterium]